MGIAGLFALAAGCELVAGIQDLSLTNAPEGGASDTANEASASAPNPDATLDPTGDAGTNATADATLDSGSDATTNGEPDGAANGDGSGSTVPDATDATSAGDASQGGDTDATGPSEPDAGGGDAADARPLVLELIDDMEGTNPSAGWLDGPLVNGTWFTFDDGSDGGILTPLPTAGAAPIISLLGTPYVTYNGIVSLHAAHVTANNGFTIYGDGMGFNVNVSMGVLPQTFDASAYQGFVFWARALGDGALGTRFNVMDYNTTAPGSGGVCDGGACSGFFGFDFGKGNMPALTSSWQMYVIYFDELTRPVYAIDDPGLSFDQTQMIGCQFQLAEGTAADLWVDDIYFIKK